MKKAVIEIGTNSTRMLIAEMKDDEINVIKKDLITTRMGEGVDSTQNLNEKSMKRGLEALKEFKSEIDEYNIKTIKLVGTSALRDVKNSQEFIDQVRSQIGYNLEIISGEKEAELIFKGVTQDLDFNDYIIIDIGGGSTEFIWKKRDEEEVNIKSIDIGAVRLTERFIDDKNNSLGRNIVDDISTYVNETLNEEIDILPGINNLIGVGGTITTMASIMLKLDEYNPESIHNYILKYSDVNKVMHILRKLTLKRREKVKGLNPDRADIIVPGIIILLETMKNLRNLKLRVSDYDILHGLIVES
ncbi:MAG: Ppx/GppA family phosphatase [Halanaerobiales bacterium]|nr:Ppx/GppA family phosphatase [Halanaerobiales bacterium]